MANSVQSALAIVVPAHLTSWIQGVRSEHDPAFVRWPPHVNLLFPFIPESDFQSNYAQIQAAVGLLPRFRLKFHTTGFFKHGPRKFVLHLKPEESTVGSLDRLQRTVQNLFPHLTKQRDVGGGTFTPHLTLGQFKSLPEVEAKMAELALQTPVEFELESISLLGRTATGPFSSKHSVYLGSSLTSAGSLNSASSDPIEPIPLVKHKRPPRNSRTKPDSAAAASSSSSSAFSQSASGEATTSSDGDFGSLFSSGTIPIPSNGDGSAIFATNNASDASSSSYASSPSSYARKPREKGTEFKSSYYKDKPSPVKSPKATTSLSAASKSPLGSKSTVTSTNPFPTTSLSALTITSPPAAPVISTAPSKYSFTIEPPTAPKFNSFATTPLIAPVSTPPSTSTTTMSAFTVSKPPPPVVISTPSTTSPKSASKPQPKAKTSSYYSGPKRATIGRKGDDNGESAPSQNDDISSMFHVEMEPYVEPEPTYKVIATASLDNSAPIPEEYSATFHRVLQWLTTLDPAKRPKNRTKLSNSITKMCVTTSAGLTAEEAVSYLVEKHYVVLKADTVSIPTKGEKELQRSNMALSKQISYNTERQAALDRCTAWVLDPDNRPRTRAALLNTLRQLIQVKKQLSPSTIVQYLVEHGSLVVLQDDKGVEHIEYQL